MAFSCFAFLSFVQFGQSQALNADVYQYTIDDGLLENYTLCMMQDSRGVIWLSTENGFQRHDVRGFKTWQQEDSLEIKRISKIHEDDQGMLWLFSFFHHNYIIFDRNTEKFKTLKEHVGAKMDSLLSSHFITTFAPISIEHQGQLAFEIPPRSFAIYKSGEFKIHELDSMYSFHSFYVDANDEFRILAQKEALEYVLLDTQQKVRATYVLSSAPMAIQPMRLDQSDILLVSDDEEGIEVEIVLDSKSKVLDWQKTLLDQFEFNMIKLENEVWFRQPDHWRRHSLEDGSILGHIPMADLISSSAYNYLLDAQKNVWIYGLEGVNLIRRKNNHFTNYFNFKTSQAKSFSNGARGILVIGDSLYANFESYCILTSLSSPDDYKIIAPFDYYRALFKTKENEIYCGAYEGLFKINKGGDILKKYEHESLKPTFDVWAINQDTNEQVWFSGGNKLFFIDRSDQVHESELSSEYDVGLIQVISSNTDNTFWISGSNGLILFDPISKKVLAKFNDFNSDNREFSDINIYHIHQDLDNVLWLSTNKGLVKWILDYQRKDDQIIVRSSQFTVFDKKNGLSSDVIYAVIEDKPHRLWLSSQHGLMLFDKNTNRTKVFLTEDGIPHNEFNRISHFQDESGRIYFGGLNGITSFQPDSIPDDDADPSIFFDITKCQYFDHAEGRVIDYTTELRQSKQINLSAQDKFFRLEFCLYDYNPNHETSYAWKIDGLQDSWVDQKEHFIEFAILPYGHHKLHIQGIGLSGNNDKNQLTFDVFVAKPFYLTYSFILAAISAIGFFIYLIFKLQTRVLRSEIDKATQKLVEDKIVIEEQNNNLKTLKEHKARFYTNISHELRTPLTLMLGPIRRLSQKHAQSPEEKELLSFLSNNTRSLKTLVDELLDIAKLENNKTENTEIPCEIIQFTKQHLGKFNSGDDIPRISFSSSSETLNILIDRQKYVKILNNYLSNAIKYSPKNSEISVDLGTNQHAITLCVSDQGPGIEADELPFVFDRFYQAKFSKLSTVAGTGIGLAFTKELSQTMHGKVWAESLKGQGSSFYFELPRKDAAPDLPDQLIKQTSDTAEQYPSETSFIIEQEDIQILEDTNILVVEDNQELCDYYRIILPTKHIVFKNNGLEAQNYLLKSSRLPDLIISDLMMPIMDGLQFLEILKASESWYSIPVIMVTAKQSEKITALRIGIDDFITKPFEEEELVIRILNLVRRFQTRKAFQAEHSTKDVAKVSQKDQVWLSQFESTVKSKIQDDNLTIAELAKSQHMSESSLLRQVKKLTGLTPKKYIQEHRLTLARQLLNDKTYNNVAAVAYQVGFKDAKSFSRSYRLRFGKPPSDIL